MCIAMAKEAEDAHERTKTGRTHSLRKTLCRFVCSVCVCMCKCVRKCVNVRVVNSAIRLDFRSFLSSFFPFSFGRFDLKRSIRNDIAEPE